MRKKSVLLTKRDIAKVLKQHPAWQVNAKGTQFFRTFKFKDYIASLVFIARISVHAEVLKHHPDIKFSYGKVRVEITTHDLKSLTKVDIALLERIDNLYKSE